MWACPSCTLEQSDRRTTCRLCDTLRPDVAIRQAALLNPPKKKKAIRAGSTVKKQAVGNKRQALRQEVAHTATLLTAETASAVTASSSGGVALHTNTPNSSSDSVAVHTVALTDGESSSDSEPSEDQCSYVPQVLMKAVGKAARVRSRQIPGLPLLPDVLLFLTRVVLHAFAGGASHRHERWIRDRAVPDQESLRQIPPIFASTRCGCDDDEQGSSDRALTSSGGANMGGAQSNGGRHPGDSRARRRAHS